MELLYSEDTEVDYFGPPCILRPETVIISAGKHTFWRSTDRGETWQANDISPMYTGLIAEADSGILYQCTRTYGNPQSFISRSEDEGFTWGVIWDDSANSGRPLSPNDMKFTDRLHGWISWSEYPGNYLLMHTSDGGNTWISDSLYEYYNPIIAMSFLDSTSGWAVTPGGNPIHSIPTLIYKWTNHADIISEQSVQTVPHDLQILSIYPNPFNSNATIILNSPNSGKMQIVVYDLFGRQADVITHSVLTKGINQLHWEGSNYATGNYFLKVTDGTQSVTGKLLLLK